MISRIFSSFSSSEPSNEEIHESSYCQDLQISFERLKQSQNKEEKIINYSNFINNFQHFICNEKNEKLLKYFSPQMIQSAIQLALCENEISNDFENQLMAIFDIIKRMLEFTTISYSTEIAELIFFLCSNNITNDHMLKIMASHEKTLEKLFLNEAFFADFVANKGVSSFFQKTFLEYKSIEICRLFRHLICEVSPISIRSTIEIGQILSIQFQDIELILTNSIDYKNRTNNINNNKNKEDEEGNNDITGFNEEKNDFCIELAILQTKLVSVNKKNCLYYNNDQNFFHLSHFIENADFETLKSIFSDLIFENPINIDIFQNIILFYQKYAKYQKQIFDWLFNLLEEKPPDLIEKVNEVVPLFSWVTHTTPVCDLLSTIEKINNINLQIIPQFLPPLFAIFCRGGASLNEYIKCIEIIERHIVLHQISLSFLLDALFLQTFVINLETAILGQLFSQSYTFAQLVYDIYELPKADSLRADVLDKLIQMAAVFPDNAHFISIFLIVSDSQKNIRDLMDLIIEKKNGELCSALGNSFPKSEIIVKFFIQEKGIEWLDKAYNMGIVDIINVRFLINSLTMRFHVRAVDKYIESLPRDHPFFKTTEDSLANIAFGYENHHEYFPLKVATLFPYLTLPPSIDFYNAYMIGRYVLDKYENFGIDVLNLPILGSIVNRYVSDVMFTKLVQKLSPEKLESLCDVTIDHFPLFQVFEFSEEYSFDITFGSISFWLKFDTKLDHYLKIPFFHTGKLQFFIKSTSLIANYEGIEYEKVIDPFKWNHIVICVSSQRASHSVKIYINSTKAVFHSPKAMSSFFAFDFSTYSTYLYLGSSIRIYSSNCKSKEVGHIFQAGPSCLNPLHENELITPYSRKYKSLKNFLKVKYHGFPSHFLSKKKLFALFDRMIDPTCDEHTFNSILRLSCKVYSILKNSLPNFMRNLLSIYTKVNQKYISLELFKNTLAFFCKYKKKEDVLDIVLSNNELWSEMNNEMIIVALIEHFKGFDFYYQNDNNNTDNHSEEESTNYNDLLPYRKISSVDQLEMFLAMRSYLIPENVFLVETLMKSLKTSRKVLIALFSGDHFLNCKKIDKFIQCNLIFDQNEIKKDDVNRNFNGVDVVDENNVNVQCSLIVFNNFQENEQHKMTLFDENLILFQKIENTVYQKTITASLKNLIKQYRRIDFLPLEDLLGLFIVSSRDMRVSLFSIFMEIEKVSPNVIQYDSIFVTLMSSLFNVESVWIEIFSLLSLDGKELSRPSLLMPLFSLLWAYTAASLNSYATTGKHFSENDTNLQNLNDFIIDKVIIFLSYNIRIISNIKSVQRYIIVWYPYLFGSSNEIKNYSKNSRVDTKALENLLIVQPQKLDDIEVVPPNQLSFISMIWNEVIDQIQINKDKNIFKNNEVEADQHHSLPFRTFSTYILSSELFRFYVDFVLSVTDFCFLEILESFLYAPFISNEGKTTSVFACDFIHLFLNSIAESYSVEMQVPAMFPAIHFMCHSGQLVNENIPTIVADVLIIASVVEVVSQNNFKKMISQLHLLLCDLFSKVEFSSLGLLYKVLTQHLGVFSQISVYTPNHFDMYLRFFLHTSIHCWEQFDNFFLKYTEFIKQLDSFDFSYSDLIHTDFIINVFETSRNKNNLNFGRVIGSLIQHEKIVEINNGDSKTGNSSTTNSSNHQGDYVYVWKRFIGSVKPFCKQVEEVLTEDRYSTLQELRELSKNFSLTYYASLQKQMRYADSLKNFSKIVKEFIDSKKQWEISVFEIQQRKQIIPITISLSNKNLIIEKEVKKNEVKLAPFSLPLRIPHLFIQTPFDDISKIEKFINTMNLYKKSLRSFEGLKGKNLVQCKIIRYSNPMISLMFESNDSFYILPFCSLSNHSNQYRNGLIINNPPLESSVVSKFVEDVVNGMWGNTTLYENRIMIRIPFYSIIYSKQIESNSIAVWSTNNGHFIIHLQNIKNCDLSDPDSFPQENLPNQTNQQNQANFTENNENVNKLMFNKLIKFGQNYPIIFLTTKIADDKEIIMQWIKNEISNSQMILGLNLIRGRDICDLRNFPAFPQDLTVFGVRSPINETLAVNLSQGLQIGKVSYSNSLEDNNKESLVKIIEFIKSEFNIILDFYKKTNENTASNNSKKEDDVEVNINDNDSNKNINEVNQNQKINEEFLEQRFYTIKPLFELDNNKPFFCQKLISNTMQIDLGVSRIIGGVPPLSIRISNSPSIYITIDREQMKITMNDFSINKKVFEEKSPVFNRARCITASHNKLFFSIDFEYNISHIYQIVYTNRNPTGIKFVRDLSFDRRQKSTSVSGVDFVAGTSAGNYFYIWHFFRNTIHRIIEFSNRNKNGDNNCRIYSNVSINENNNNENNNNENNNNKNNNNENNNNENNNNENNNNEFNNNVEIIFHSFDESSSTFWICCESKSSSSLYSSFDLFLFLIGVNGEVFCRFYFDKCTRRRLTAFSVVPQPLSINMREAICGFSDGSVCILSPFILNGSRINEEVEMRIFDLNSKHSQEVKKIVYHPNSPYFATIDIGGAAYIWTQKGNKGSAEFDIAAFNCCPLCGKKENPIVKHCNSCKRAFCNGCIKQSNICPDCSD